VTRVSSRAFVRDSGSSKRRASNKLKRMTMIKERAKAKVVERWADGTDLRLFEIKRYWLNYEMDNRPMRPPSGLPCQWGDCLGYSRGKQRWWWHCHDVLCSAIDAGWIGDREPSWHAILTCHSRTTANVEYRWRRDPTRGRTTNYATCRRRQGRESIRSRGRSGSRWEKRD
jgi:hypothetical protein